MGKITLKSATDTPNVYRKNRYSNAPIDLFEDLGRTGDQTDLPEDYFSSGSGFDLNNLLDNIFKTGNTFISSFWNTGDKAQLQAYQQMYNQQQKTTTILWIAIGLIVALGVVLLLRKTK